MCADHDDTTERACGDGCACRSAAAPEEMRRMVRALGVGGLLQGAARAEAGELCATCTDRDACRDWLDVAVIRGADHAPDFCLNGERFAALASEAPATI